MPGKRTEDDRQLPVPVEPNISREELDNLRAIVASDRVGDYVAEQVSGYLKQSLLRLNETAGAMSKMMRVGDGRKVVPLDGRFVNAAIALAEKESRMGSLAHFIEQDDTASEVVDMLMRLRFMKPEEILAFAKKILDIARKRRNPIPVQEPVKQSRGILEALLGPRGKKDNQRSGVDPVEEVMRSITDVDSLVAFFEIMAWSAGIVVETDADLTKALARLESYGEETAGIVAEAREVLATFKAGEQTRQNLSEQMDALKEGGKRLNLMEGNTDSREQVNRFDAAFDQIEKMNQLGRDTSFANVKALRDKLRMTSIYDGRDQVRGQWRHRMETALVRMQMHFIARSMMTAAAEALAGILQGAQITKSAMRLLVLQEVHNESLLYLTEKGAAIVNGLDTNLDGFRKMLASGALREEGPDPALPAGGDDSVIDGEYTKSS